MTLAIVGLFAATEEAQALVCGDTIFADTTLTANLGPCAGDGLIIATPGVTLDLNKKSIIGDGICPVDPDCFTGSFVQTGSGVTVLAGATDVTIKNGTIKDSFRNGINILAGSHGAVVENMKLRDNLVFAV